MAAPEAGQSIGFGGLLWLTVLFGGVIFWAFFSKSRKKAKEDPTPSDQDPPPENHGPGS